MSVGMFLLGAIACGGISWLIINLSPLYGKLEKKFSLDVAWWSCIVIIPLIIGLLGGSITGIAFGGHSSTTTSPSHSSKVSDSYGHDAFDAEVIAEKIVKTNLKSPSTADFCKHSEYRITCSGDTWTVKGYVDAQNGFGATIRNEFTVKFTFISSERYTTDYCKIY